MQYLLMLHAEEAGWERLTKEQQQQGAAAYMAYGEALKQAGVLRGSNRLRPSSAATTVRLTNGKPQAGAGATQSLLGTTRRADGRLQVTYHGHPLYTFVLDTKAGQTKGEGLNKFGAVWNAVSPNGSKIPKPTTGGGGGGGGGYGGGGYGG